MGPNIKEEFQLKNFGLGHNKPKEFVSSQWGCPTLYILWRVCWPLYHFGWIIASGVLNFQWASSEENRVKWFIYLTNWTYFMLTVETIVEAIILIYVRIWRKDIVQGLNKDMPWFLKLLWILYNIATTASFIVTALYWSMIFKASKGVNPVSLAVHGINSVYVFLNLFITAVPNRILHFYQPVIYGIIYTVFTAVYHAANGTNMRDQPYVYSVLNWDKPTKTIIMAIISTFIAIPIMHLFVYLLYFIRVSVYHQCRNRKEQCKIEDQKENGSHKNGQLKKSGDNNFDNGGYIEKSSMNGKVTEQNSKTNLIIDKF
ncbi:protein rolling stone [Patella vulgata]|uniref:protein rolling stone n=1 Tax=Patella vulgata TaxID=6465 RepID=UPI00217FE8DD|nr:protein rolling stone [Patella vulgata]XP_055958370.1 protein rolling stone [Patella vulgata]